MGRSVARWAAVFLMAHAVHGAAASDVIFISSFAVEPPSVLDITAAHNAVRAAVGVGPLFWDERLAATAQAWANTCTPSDDTNTQVGHNPTRSGGYPWNVGENIASANFVLSSQNIVNLWASEQQYYDHDTNTCSAVPPQTCSHYTQIVWANTYALGCGTATCANLSLPDAVVCNYGPAGNVSGESPY